MCCGLIQSSDDKWLYILNRGELLTPQTYRSGAVYVVDVALQKLVNRQEIPAACDEALQPQSGSPIILSEIGPKDRQGKLYRFNRDQPPTIADAGNGPLEIRRLANQDGFWVISEHEMRFIEDGVSSFSNIVPLSPSKKTAASSNASLFLDGFPEQIVYLPMENKLVMGRRNKSDILAIVDLKSSRIERIVKVGRPGVKTLNVTAEIISTPLGWTNSQRQWLQLSPSSDGKYVYAFHAPTQDVTILQIQNGTILDTIPATGSEMRIASNGRFLYSYGPYGMTWIDLQSRKKVFDYHPPSGTIQGLRALGDGGIVATLTSKSVVFWDATIGKQVATIEERASPLFVLEPSMKVQSSHWSSSYPGLSTCLGRDR